MAFDPLVRRRPDGLAARPKLTQGTIFDGLRLPRYGDGRYSGLLITARCDLAHVRTDTLNLLPVVPLIEWLRYDGCIAILLSRVLALGSKIERTLSELPEGYRDLLREDWDEAFSLFVEGSADVAINLKNKLRDAIQEWKHFSSAVGKCGSAQATTALIAQDDKIRDVVLKGLPTKISDLVENKVMDAYFLPVLHPEEPLDAGPGYVVLFRQILALPGALVAKLVHGISSANELPDTLRAHGDLLHFPSGAISMVASPFVEHIMQRFSSVFGRIGVEDCPLDYKSLIIERAQREVAR